MKSNLARKATHEVVINEEVHDVDLESKTEMGYGQMVRNRKNRQLGTRESVGRRVRLSAQTCVSLTPLRREVMDTGWVHQQSVNQIVLH
jgi:hypothetical protein